MAAEVFDKATAEGVPALVAHSALSALFSAVVPKQQTPGAPWMWRMVLRIMELDVTPPTHPLPFALPTLMARDLREGALLLPEADALTHCLATKFKAHYFPVLSSIVDLALAVMEEKYLLRKRRREAAQGASERGSAESPDRPGRTELASYLSTFELLKVPREMGPRGGNAVQGSFKLIRDAKLSCKYIAASLVNPLPDQRAGGSAG